MIKQHILKLIKDHQPQLSKFHVKAIYLFGSVARDEDTAKSDIDILVSFNIEPTFDLYMDLKFYLEDLCGRKVDLVTEEGLREEIRSCVMQDLIHAA